jgi:DNA-binding response OmpR family regulator
MDIKILVVEDDKHIRETVKAYLIDAGYQVDTCADGTIIPNYEKIEVGEIVKSVVALYETLTEAKEQQINDEPIDEVNILLGGDTILELIVISLLLASVAGFTAISRITKYEPIKILMERN